MTKPGQDVISWYSDLDPDTQGDLTDYYNDVAYDHFRDDEIYQTVFAQGDWGDIKDATLDTFGEVKTYINDTIFATEHQTVYEDDEYVPSVKRSIDGAPRYLDVSEYYDKIDKTLPKLYREPSGVAMPHSMMRYSSRAHLAKAEHGGWDTYWNRGDRFKSSADDPFHVGKVDTIGDYQSHLDQVKEDRIEAGKESFTDFLEENQERADAIWTRRSTLEGTRFEDEKYELGEVDFGRYDDETKPLFKEVIGSDDKEDIQAWMAMAGVQNLEYENFDNAAEDLMSEDGKIGGRIKFVYDYYGGVLPTTQQEFETRGDPLIEWGKDKGKSWRKENN